jgi:hypothetical protein
MTFDSTERATLAGLADVLIPAGEGFPAASAAGVAGEGLDQLLAVRPDLMTALKKILLEAKGRSPADVVKQLQAKDPAAFGVLAEVVPGAYFMNAQVRAALGYSGQSPRPIDPRPDYLDDGLLQSVINRGPVYRPTPRPGKS